MLTLDTTTVAPPDEFDALSDAEIEELFSAVGLDEKPDFTLEDLWIVTKDNKLVRLEPNDSQVMYLDDIQESCLGFDWRNGKVDISGLRLDVLKYRQWGCSTITTGLYLLDCVNHPFVKSTVIAHNPPTTVHLLGIARTMFQNFDKARAPKLVRDNRGEMAMATGSVMQVLQVGSKGAGRGLTPKNVLESERAFWPTGANEIEFGLLQGVPKSGNVVRETTANGLDEFYEQYTDRKSEYKKLFYGWAPHKEYSDTVPGDFDRDEKESTLQRLYDLTDGQLVWRRRKIAEAERLGKRFQVEFPLNASEAFIGQTNNYYNTGYLKDQLDFMWSSEGELIHSPQYEVEQGENGFHAGFKVWKEPEFKHFYIVGADPGGGVSKSGRQNHSSLHIFDLDTWEEVLHYHGDPDPWDFGADIAALATWYNDAYCVVLRLNHGHEVIRALQETGCMGIVTDKDDQYGLLENSKSKVKMDDQLGTIINEMANGEPGLILHSSDTVAELITYGHLPGGKAGAQGTANDDRQCSLKAVVWQLGRDDRRYKIPLKEPPPVQPAYLSTRR